MQGAFIVLDGNDGSGKATQSRLLKARLDELGVAAEHLDFPGYERNIFGALLGECLAGMHGDFLTLDPKIVSCLYALDRFTSAAQIREARAAGKVVIADRFTSSNQMHQGGKVADPVERAAFLAWLDQVEHEELSIPRPDVIVYLDVPVEISLELLQKKRAAKNPSLAEGVLDLVEQDRLYLERSRAVAAELSEKNDSWRRVDCMKDNVLQSPEAVHELIWSELIPFLPITT